MELIEILLIGGPIVVASIFLLIAALQKKGKERGSGLVFTGALLVMLEFVIALVFYVVLAPILIEKMALDDHGTFYFITNTFFTLVLASGFLAIALGTFKRDAIGGKVLRDQGED